MNCEIRHFKAQTALDSYCINRVTQTFSNNVFYLSRIVPAAWSMNSCAKWPTEYGVGGSMEKPDNWPKVLCLPCDKWSKSAYARYVPNEFHWHHGLACQSNGRNRIWVCKKLAFHITIERYLWLILLWGMHRKAARSLSLDEQEYSLSKSVILIGTYPGEDKEKVTSPVGWLKNKTAIHTSKPRSNEQVISPAVGWNPCALRVPG